MNQTIAEKTWSHYLNGFITLADLITEFESQRIRGNTNAAGNEFIGYDYARQCWIVLTA